MAYSRSVVIPDDEAYAAFSAKLQASALASADVMWPYAVQNMSHKISWPPLAPHRAEHLHVQP